jgi:hypothetical protein
MYACGHIPPTSELLVLVMVMVAVMVAVITS